ncbi:30 kDa heat shock protein [Beauveria bassiana ARSEF 2860]|uniref:30 kDa heat shock protein n=1 Tax=Beauveria bassiana (strain ARSEF 2860) TaxID=655819 RepID=J4VQ78_BEAB2|nr:30 kDa heat shock protein [Beauveria bassiana ARSEF 2860]EJP60845.1 30 kDa heat shock protein [Beauveria bassiana ARSEF 2860]
MSRLKDHYAQHDEHDELAELEPESLKTCSETPTTPMRRRELMPRSAAQPSTRRVRRLNGERLAAANPLFQPWTAESSKKVLEFSKNISPRKTDSRTKPRSESVTGEAFLVNRKHTRQGANTTVVKSMLPSAAFPDIDSSSSSVSDMDIGDVTLPASLQLANQPTESSHRIARLRPDTCITILEDSIFAETASPETEAQITQVEGGTGGEAVLMQSEPLPLTTRSVNVRQQSDDTIDRQLMHARAHVPQPIDKEHLNATNKATINEFELTEQLVDEQLWGNGLGHDGEISDARVTVPWDPLQSPRKTFGIPQRPHTPTKDEFWRQSLVDCWNDEQSPRKAVEAAMRSPIKQSIPTKSSKSSFEAARAKLAVEFLNELDNKITDGKIAQLSKSTGGVKIEWSKNLNTTAGRANWRKETIRTIPSDGSDATITYHHHASIELAEKVIDDESRLLNVLAHEFCHLANFMISSVTDKPHGKDFKLWAAKCSRTFASRGIKVTTKHNYEIDFKYVWQCEGCSYTYKRHSKSINPEKHRCSGCKGNLTQIKPVPRIGGKPSEYQLFIKEEMKSLKRDNPGSPQTVIMKMAAGKWADRLNSTRQQHAQEDVGDITAKLHGLGLGEK